MICWLRGTAPVLFAAAFVLAARANDVLFIGNSFTFGATVPGLAENGGVPKMVDAIARSKGIDLQAESVTSPGKDWKWHLAQPATAVALASKRWDWLVLQDFSTRPTRMGDVAQFMRDGVTFSRRLAQHSPKAGIVLYETWARPPGKFYQTQGGRQFAGPGEMMGDLHQSYIALARKLAASEPGRPVRVALVGTAMARCHAEFPAIPLDAADQHHATAQGYYLAALVIFETIYHQTADDAPLRFFGGVVTISSQDAADLQRVADEVAGPQPAAPEGPFIKAGERVVCPPLQRRLLCRNLSLQRRRHPERSATLAWRGVEGPDTVPMVIRLATTALTSVPASLCHRVSGPSTSLGMTRVC